MIKLGSERVHLDWSAEHEPILTIQPGQTVVIDAREGSNCQICSPVTAELLEEHLHEILDQSRMVPLTGPISVEGALPGDTLRIEILDLIPKGEGTVYSFPAWHQVDFLDLEYRKQFPAAYLKHFDLEEAVRNGYVDLTAGVRIELNPMLGMIGTAPANGRFAVNAPREFGGNMDCKLICKGSTLYLPVFVPGGNLSIGDGHAAQGDGEICATGIECAIEATLRIGLEKEYSFSTPFVETQDKYIALGYGRDLDQAAKRAIQQMIEFFHRYKRLSRYEAYATLSLAGNLIVNQVVNFPHLGVRLEVAKSIFRC